MKKNISIKVKEHFIDLITNGAEKYKNIVICFHGFNGDKWGEPYSGLKKILTDSLVVSFDSCGHGESKILSEDMRLNLILEEIDAAINFFNQEEIGKPIILIAHSYGAYRIMQYLIKYKPKIEKIIYVNPAFKMLETLEKTKEFKYEALNQNEKIIMKRSLNKFMKKEFLDDLYNNNLYSRIYDIDYQSKIVIGTRDSLIPLNDTLEIAKRYNYDVIYIDENHNFENKENWQIVADIARK